MVSAAKAFSSEPPREPLTNLRTIVEDFQWRYKDRRKTDQVIEYCGAAPTFAEAVRRAVEARDANGKHHNHQSKVDITARRKFGSIICSSPIKKHVMHIAREREPIELAPDWHTPFDELHDLFDEHKPYGIGPVTVYDVAVRVGAYLGIEPEQVYMHAGVRQGLKALEQALGSHPSGKRLAGAHKLKRVPMYLFPKPFRKVSADDVEDMLCTYREVFLTW